MADLDLRTAARAASAFPSPEAEATFLRARLRAGTLSLERLELAAYCGHEAALAIVPRPHGAPSDCGLCHGHPDGILVMHAATNGLPPWTREPCEHELAPWVRGLSRWGPTVQVRAAVAAARAALTVWAERHSRGHPDARFDASAMTECCVRPRASVEAAERWLAEPSEENRLDCRRLHDGSIGTTSGPWRFVLSLVCVAGDPRGHAPDALESDAHNAQILSVSLAGQAPVRAAIQAALIAWALGGDL